MFLVVIERIEESEIQVAKGQCPGVIVRSIGVLLIQLLLGHCAVAIHHGLLPLRLGVLHDCVVRHVELAGDARSVIERTSDEVVEAGGCEM
jgi:hypothetical protein